MSDGKVLHATRDAVHVLRFVGDIRYTLSPAIDAFIREVFSSSPPEGFVVDLTETETIDSTNLGLLARIAKLMKGHNGSRVTILSDRADINAVLTSMAFDQVFNIVSGQSVQSGEEKELPQQDVDEQTLFRTVLDTHRELMAISEQNREMFRDVVTSLENNKK